MSTPLDRGVLGDIAGKRVRVPAGTRLVYDTGPDFERPFKTLRRAQTVTVHHVLYPRTIIWAGSGGYWKGAEFSDEMDVLP